MKGKQVEIEKLLDLPDEVLLKRLANPYIPALEWVAVSAVIDQRNRGTKEIEE